MEWTKINNAKHGEFAIGGLELHICGVTAILYQDGRDNEWFLKCREADLFQCPLGTDLDEAKQDAMNRISNRLFEKAIRLRVAGTKFKELANERLDIDAGRGTREARSVEGLGETHRWSGH